MAGKVYVKSRGHFKVVNLRLPYDKLTPLVIKSKPMKRRKKNISRRLVTSTFESSKVSIVICNNKEEIQSQQIDIYLIY